jgi:hypothetical protein
VRFSAKSVRGVTAHNRSLNYNPSMTRTLTFVLAAACSLTACSKNSSQPASAAVSQPSTQTSAQPAVATKSGDPVQQKVAELAGSGAKDCGRPSSTERSALDTAASCVMETSQAKKPFSVIYDMPGMSVAIAGNSDGKSFAVQAITPEGGTAPQISVSPCPAELRVAQSGRVTCFPQGTMGVPPGAANPHAGTASGTSPHGGMGMPPPGTANPHAGNMTTKPTAKTPPQ